jgi:hypothetical protein
MERSQERPHRLFVHAISEIVDEYPGLQVNEQWELSVRGHECSRPFLMTGTGHKSACTDAVYTGARDDPVPSTPPKVWLDGAGIVYDNIILRRLKLWSLNMNINSHIPHATCQHPPVQYEYCSLKPRSNTNCMHMWRQFRVGYSFFCKVTRRIFFYILMLITVSYTND